MSATGPSGPLVLETTTSYEKQCKAIVPSGVNSSRGLITGTNLVCE